MNPPMEQLGARLTSRFHKKKKLNPFKRNRNWTCQIENNNKVSHCKDSSRYIFFVSESRWGEEVVRSCLLLERLTKDLS